MIINILKLFYWNTILNKFNKKPQNFKILRDIKRIEQYCKGTNKRRENELIFFTHNPYL